MSYINQFVGTSKVTKEIGGPKAVAGWGITDAASPGFNTKSVLSGAMTANTLKSIVSITGSAGSIDLLSVESQDSTSRTARIKITIDNTVVFDYTSAAANASGSIGNIIGTISGSVVHGGLVVRWNNSILIECASNNTETDKFKFYYRYNLER